MRQLKNKPPNKPTPSGKPARPKKPLPTKEETAKIPIPISSNRNLESLSPPH